MDLKLFTLLTALLFPLPANAQTLRVFLDEPAFPPVAQKLTVGSFFIRTNSGLFNWINNAGGRQMPMYRSNIREARENYTGKANDFLGNRPLVTSNPKGFLYASGTNVLPNFDRNLDAMRARVAAHQMIHYIRWDGVPFMATPDTSDDLFLAPTNYGTQASDASPPCAPQDRLKFAQAMGAFAAMLRANESVWRPTVWSFWQEPDHTLGDPSQPYNATNISITEAEKQANVRMLVRDFYRHLAREIRAADPDYLVGGIAQNASAAEWQGPNLDPAGPRIGGSRLGHTIDEWLSLEATNNETYPLDQFSLQLYQAEDSEAFHIPNSRYALKNIPALYHPTLSNRFDRTPIIVTEYNYKKTDLFPDWTGESKYHLDSAQFREVMENYIYFLNQPDVAYLVTKLDGDNGTTQQRRDLWLEAFGDLPEMRLAVTPTDSLNALASFSPSLGLHAFIWNPTGQAATNIVQLAGLANAGLDASQAQFFRLELNAQSNAVWTPLWAGAVSNGVAGVTQSGAETWTVSTAANDILFVAINGNPTYTPGALTRTSRLRQARYGSHNAFVPRTTARVTDRFGRLVPLRPPGMGHFDPISGTMTVGVENTNGVGLVGLALRDVPDDYLLRLDLQSLGLAPGQRGPDATLRLRVDYLDGETALKSVNLNESSFTGAGTFANVNWFPAAPEKVTMNWSFFADGAVLLPLGDWHPIGWSAANAGRRRVRLSLFLAGVPQPATLVATVTDQSRYVPATASLAGPEAIQIAWHPATNATYGIWSTTNLAQRFQLLQSGLATNEIALPSMGGSGQRYYRVTADGN
jgi:hypothetical protein